MRSSLAEFEKLRAPVLLVSDLDLIVFANSHAQEALLDVDVVDMPIQGFICDWHRCRPRKPTPTAINVEVLLRSGQYATRRAVVFQLKLDMALVSGIALLPRHPNL